MEDAVAALPYVFCVFDEDERVVLASNQFYKSFAGLDLDKDKPLHEQSITVTDIARAKLADLPHDRRDERLEKELARLRASETNVKDLLLGGKWMRRIKAGAPGGQSVILAVPIEELVQRARDLVEAKQEMEHQALHDPLTDLPNRRALNNYLENLLKSDSTGNCPIAVFHVDLDKFKLVNDSLGHDAGDQVLLEASRILRSEVRSSDFVARVGGDEFVLVFTSLADRQAIERVATRIVERMREPIYYDDHCCQIGATVGIAISEKFTTPERVIMDADIAMYEAKLAGRGRFSVFNSVQRAKHSAFKKRVFEVREAIMMNAFEPFFQPQVCARSGRILRFEAVARWRHLEMGLKPPSEFLSAIAEANLTFELDDMIIKKALRRLAHWDEEGIEVPAISVNIASAYLAKPDIAEQLLWTCDELKIDPDRLGFEILENVVGRDQSGTIGNNVELLKARGFKIALDNFGSGSASISSLRNLGPDQIKISREFISDIHNDEDNRTITSAIISLAKKLGLEVIAEAVEHPSEREVLEHLGIDGYQGFLVGKPMESDLVPIWIADYYEELVLPQKSA